ncbi:isopentenyl-diphosphate delta-isomerase [Plakobranchus ocellatus]|uniref:isopentenyl-diphosphate Delta-isomerase n=1 Tax=Plakobranchus ocellatus TaxID=259542 RepID=A0AAV4BD90_9GAST|nr:isopentenyl-diphosphate delta-isomerase [Plakobranchus ocellatus]
MIRLTKIVYVLRNATDTNIRLIINKSQGIKNLTTQTYSGHRSDIVKNYSSSAKMSGDDILKGLDETQAKLMEEECILVNRNDERIGSASKKICHLLENINKGMLHRAFSVFLFNLNGDLLLQQRAIEKITFPDHFTNTCCSHPLNFEAELEEEGAIGVKRAAQRKLKHELGIEPQQIPLEDFHFLTRILYKADNVPHDGKWGEHEIDYILFIQKDVTVNANPNEVKSYRYVSQKDLKDLIDSSQDKGMLLTPWFKLICNNFLFKWWNKLNDVESQADRKTIHYM